MSGALYEIANGRSLRSVVAEEMARHGMEPVDPNDLRTDGALCRFDCAGDKPGKRNAWAVIFADGVRPVAVFGHWAKNIRETVVLGKAGPMTSGERERANMAMDAARRDRERTVAKAREGARRDAAAKWKMATAAPDSHPYLMAKKISGAGLRVLGLNLLVPMYDASGTLQNLQQIHPNGRKRFLKGGALKDLYASMGTVGERILIAEGWATGASLHQATGLPVAVAFCVGNLDNIGLMLHRKYPDATLVFCADNDVHDNRENIGVERARAAARLIPGGAYVAIPPTAGDWNDHINAADGGLPSLREELIHE